MAEELSVYKIGLYFVFHKLDSKALGKNTKAYNIIKIGKKIWIMTMKSYKHLAIIF